MLHSGHVAFFEEAAAAVLLCLKL
ncbi:MAG: hypothetical protein MUC78_09030 [Bacteroidales bacterium]|nr:hypothetical protein [Bacteroidales bacterium]